MSESPDTQAEAVCPGVALAEAVENWMLNPPGVTQLMEAFAEYQRVAAPVPGCSHCFPTPSAEPDGEAQYVPGPEFNECIREDCPAFHVVWGERNYFQGHPPKGIHVTPPCGSCGEPSIHRITLRGEPMPVCLRHLNHWRTPAPAQDGEVAFVESMLTDRAAQDGAEVEALAGGIPRDDWDFIVNTVCNSETSKALIDWLSQRDKDRDAAVAAKVAEQIAQAIDGENSEWQGTSATTVGVKGALDHAAKLARAAAQAGDER